MPRSQPASWLRTLPRRPRGRPEEHDVAGHVRDEHMSELQVAGGVDDAGDERERDHHRHQRAVTVPRRRGQRVKASLQALIGADLSVRAGIACGRASFEVGDDVRERRALGHALLLHRRAEVQQPDWRLLARQSEIARPRGSSRSGACASSRRVLSRGRRAAPGRRRPRWRADPRVPRGSPLQLAVATTSVGARASFAPSPAAASSACAPARRAFAGRARESATGS